MLLYRIAPDRVSYPLGALRAVNTASNLCLTINSIAATAIFTDLYEIWYGAVDKMKMISP